MQARQKKHFTLNIMYRWLKTPCIIHLNNTYWYVLFMHISGGGKMRTTLNIEDDLVERASKLTGIKEKTSLVRKGLETLISIESSKRLAALGGSEKKIRMPRRRRSES
jgi:Arc/MetJ family transcription regulator